MPALGQLIYWDTTPGLPASSSTNLVGLPEILMACQSYGAYLPLHSRIGVMMRILVLYSSYTDHQMLHFRMDAQIS